MYVLFKCATSRKKTQIALQLSVLRSVRRKRGGGSGQDCEERIVRELQKSQKYITGRDKKLSPAIFVEKRGEL